MRCCIQCSTTKPLAEFYARSGNRCKACVISSRKEYYQRNKAKVIKCNNAYTKKRRAIDPLFDIRHRARDAIRKGIERHRATKKSNTRQMLGCSYAEALVHLIDSALRNYGFYLYDEIYHIDHIVPLASAKSEEDVIRLNYYTNLQFLTAEDNLRKHAKINQEV